MRAPVVASLPVAVLLPLLYRLKRTGVRFADAPQAAPNISAAFAVLVPRSRVSPGGFSAALASTLRPARIFRVAELLRRPEIFDALFRLP